MKWFCVLTLLLFSAEVSLAFQPSDVESTWEKGRKAENEGRYLEALNIWETELTNSVETAYLETNPRLGFDYIRLATRQNFTEYYRKASTYYFRSLREGCANNYRKIMALELERTAPILDKKEYSRLKDAFKNDLSSFCTQLVSFWEKIDPTFSNNYNERLLEHWERIAYAREHFLRSKNTVYDTDDRGLVYVRLGEPDLIKNGTMQFNYGLVRSWIQDIIDSQSHTGISMGSFSGDSAGNTGSIFTGQNSEYFEVEKIAREALLTIRYPYYEIWVYRDLNNSKHNNLVYIFGEDGDDGSFGLRNSLDEMIPSSAFRRSDNKGLVTSGLILQLLYYEQTSQIDTYFEEAYHDIESRILTRNGLNRKTSTIVEDQNRNILATKQYRAPVQETSIYDVVSAIELESYQYRFLNKENKPFLATFVKSRPQTSLYLDQVKEKNYTSADYKLVHHLLTISGDDSILDKQQKISRMHLDQQGSTGDMKPSYAYFETLNIAEGAKQSITVELQNTSKDSITVTDKIVSNNIRAIGNIAKLQPMPLTDDPDILELSDILIGQKVTNADSASKGLTNFSVIHDKKISEQTDLMIHFQIYHLNLQNRETTNFRVEYRVSKKQKGFLKKLFGSNNETGLTLNFETREPYSINNLEIDTKPFGPGSYELSLKVIEPATGREASRTVSFEINES